MYLTPDEFREAQHYGLQLFSDISNTCLDAGSRFTEMFAQSGWQALEWSGDFFAKAQRGFSAEGADKLAALLPSHPLNDSPRMQEEFCEILNDIVIALVRAAETQIRICDKLLSQAIENGTRHNSPEESKALDTLRAATESAESALPTLTDVVVADAAIAENQPKQAAKKSMPSVQEKKASTRSRKAANQ